MTFIQGSTNLITDKYGKIRARYYNPVIGRFTQEDVYRGYGLNLYAYCNNNPVEYCDPSGYAKKICKDGGPKENNHGNESGTDSIGNIGNPSDNPKVLADAMEDSTAVYGYRPREDGSIKQFANYDWSDSKVVAELREIRLDYLQENRSYQNMVDNMRNAGCSDTEIAQ